MFYTILVGKVAESEGEGGILEPVIKVPRADTFSCYPGCF
jgi:hypothetical protein